MLILNYLGLMQSSSLPYLMGSHIRADNENNLQFKPYLWKIPAALSCLCAIFPSWYLFRGAPLV